MTGAEFLRAVPATIAQHLGESSHHVVGDRRGELVKGPSAGLAGAGADATII
jgi:hypothetical protein